MSDSTSSAASAPASAGGGVRFLGAKRSFRLPKHLTKKNFTVQQHAAGTKGIRKGQLTLELEAGVLVIQRSGKLRRTAVEHIRHMVVHRDPQTGSTANSPTLELQFDYNGSDTVAGRSIKVFDFENGHSRENFQRLVLALLYCRQALAPLFDPRERKGTVADGAEPAVSVGDILKNIFHKQHSGLSASTASALLNYEDALLFCNQEIENQGMSLRPPFLMNQTEFMEYLPQTCDVMLSCMLNGQVSKIPVYGRVYLTSYRLVFMPHFFSYADRNVKAYPFQIPLLSLVAVKLVDGGCVVAAQTKTLRSLKFTFQDAADTLRLFQKVVALTYKDPTSPDLSSYAFSRAHVRLAQPAIESRRARGLPQDAIKRLESDMWLDVVEQDHNTPATPAPPRQRRGLSPRPPPPHRAPKVGWAAYNEMAEFARMNALGHSSPWALYDNSDFRALPSYPPFVLLPRPELFNEKEILGVMGFRSKRRIPAIVWVHPTNGRVIARCSMPLVGVSKKNSADDEKLAEIYRCSGNVQQKRGIFGVTTLVGEDSEQAALHIFDARPTLNSAATRLKGGGQEDEGRYNRAVMNNLGIGNIHVMRNSLTALARCCENLDDSDAAAGSARADWLHHIHLILKGATRLARVVGVEKCSAIVHCSDGWDRTPQLTATAQVLLDPFYRTFDGFAVLVEKEWCSFGHKFGQRHAHGEPPKHAREDDVDTRGYQRYFSNSKECSPIFVQWLDVCHQLLAQFPTSFEFSEALLLFLAEHVHSCQFGNFLCDNSGARAKAGVYEHCRSIWDFLRMPSNRAKFQNPRFIPFPDTLWPLTNQIQLRLWHSYFSRLETLQIPAPLPAEHERVVTIGQGDEWMAEHGFERFPPDVLKCAPCGPLCKVRVRRMDGTSPTWNDCWGLTVRNNQLHLYRRSDFANMELEEIVDFKPHIAIDLDAIEVVRELRQDDVELAENAAMENLRHISESVDVFGYGQSPSARRGAEAASLASPVRAAKISDSLLLRLKESAPGPNWCLQFPGMVAFEFWKRYLDHVNKGLDFLTMVSAGQLQQEEYELIMKKNADHIGLSNPMAGLRRLDAADIAIGLEAGSKDACGPGSPRAYRLPVG
eukprot:INCI7666.1.p1 GENE.INCI7666.1~~INCI7666.1.p1  ORF type:complete len:1155 (+),score=173.22 INCI7666.1:158-3466(+)